MEEKQSGTTGSMKLIVMAAQEAERPDRGGGTTHSFGNVIFKDAIPKDVPVDKFERELNEALDRLPRVLAQLKARAIDGWAMDSVSISLAVSAEGSIGIATVGTEASIEVSFSRKA
jgi:hypothetical protein